MPAQVIRNARAERLPAAGTDLPSWDRRAFLYMGMGSALSSCLGTGTSLRESSARAAGSEALPPASELADCGVQSVADTVVVSSMTELEVAVAAAPAGRHILVAPGKYGVSTISLHGNGTEDKPIVIRPQDGLGTVTIDDPRWTFSKSSSWLIVERFYFGGSRIILQGDHNRIARCRFRNINVSASIVTHAARDCRIDHCDFADLNPPKGSVAQPIDVKPKYFGNGVAACLLIDYCYFHDMNPAFGQNGMELARTHSVHQSLELARGETVTLDHCLFENIDIPKEGEVITVKMGGWVTRFWTFDNVGLYYSFRQTQEQRT